MRGVLKRLAVLVLVGAVLASLGEAFVAAQNAPGNGFRISPVRSEFTIEKGATETLVVTVENPTGGPITARGVVNNFIASEKENGEPRLILEDNAPQPRNNFKKLIGPIPDTPLAPRQKKDIQVSINIPKDAESGGYYGAIRFLPVNSQDDGNVALTASVGTIVLVKVPGNLTERLSLESLGAAQNGKSKSFLTSGDVDVAVRLKNIGNIHVQPFGKVQVKNMFGKVVKEYELNANDPRANILPDSVRRFDDPIAKPKPMWFGRYSITANIGYSQGSGDLISAKASFWYLPTWFLIFLFVLILAIVGAVFWFVKMRGGGGRRAHKSGAIRRF